MERIIIIVLSIFLISNNLYCQVQLNDIYEAFNQIVEINDVNILSKKAKPMNIHSRDFEQFVDWFTTSGDERIDLSDFDTNYMIDQIKSFNELKWDKAKINKKINFKRKSIDYFTIPLFISRKNDLIVVQHSEYYGPLASQGFMELYKKKQGRWKLINLSFLWVS